MSDTPNTSNTPNIYLVKIAGIVGALAGAAGSAGRIVGKGGKAFANQVHLATGGAFRNHAMNSLGIKDPTKLMKFDGSYSGIKAMARQTQKTMGKGPEARTAFRKTVKDLKSKQLDARIVAGGATAVGAVAVSKAKDKISEKNTPSNYYQNY